MLLSTSHSASAQVLSSSVRSTIWIPICLSWPYDTRMSNRGLRPRRDRVRRGQPRTYLPDTNRLCFRCLHRHSINPLNSFGAFTTSPIRPFYHLCQPPKSLPAPPRRQPFHFLPIAPRDQNLPTTLPSRTSPPALTDATPNLDAYTVLCARLT